MASLEKVSASGRVVRVAPTYVYIYSEQYGSVFSYPASYIKYLPEKPESSDLTELLRVDDVVHFVAIPQKGPNDCRWIAVKITKSQLSTTAQNGSTTNAVELQSKDLPDVIRDASGTIIELYEQNGFLFSEKYGKIYFPMAAAEPMCESNELHPLNELFVLGDLALFDGKRQPYKNECLYYATRVRHLPSDYVEDAQGPLRPSVQASREKATRKNSKTTISTNTTMEDTSADLAYEEGEISKLFPQYGFIRSDKLGSVYFTMAHFDSSTGLLLVDDLTVGDRVRFLPMPQQEKSGCRWRGIKVHKMEPDFISSLSQLVDGSDALTCEVSVQTDQSLWNTFLAAQASAVNKRRIKLSVETASAACQTRMPPEALLLKAVKEDDEFKAVLKDRFPHLMLFIDKTT